METSLRILNGKVLLSSLAKKLGTSSSNLKYHITNGGILGIESEKLFDRATGDLLLEIDSVLKFIEWAFTHSRKLDYNKLVETKEELSGDTNHNNS